MLRDDSDSKETRMALFLSDGTRVTKANVAVTEDPDPLVRLDTDLYQLSPYGEWDDSIDGGKRTLFARAGKIMRRSELDALFEDAEVDAITPNTGVAAGGTVVTITGDDLNAVSGVTFGGDAGTAFTRVSKTEVEVTTPPHAAGVVDVVLAADAGDATVAGGFTYTP